jgi:anti-sigma28 factor (negative regulator of flagellin synthesis)
MSNKPKVEKPVYPMKPLADKVYDHGIHGKITVKDTEPPVGKVTVKKEELEKDSANPALAPKEVKIKELQGKIDAGTYKPNPAKIADKMLKDEDMMMSEELECSANGQWNLKKGAFKRLEHKLEGEGKSEESAGAIAASIGDKKYGKAGMEAKAEAAKKAEDEDMMMSEELECSANGQWNLKKAKRNIENMAPNHPIHAALSHEANERTHASTGVHVHDEEGLAEHGENSWYGEHGRHLEDATKERESGKLNPKIPKAPKP